MPSIHSPLTARDAGTEMDSQKLTLNYAIIALGLVFFGLLLTSTLLLLRRVKRQQQMRDAAMRLPHYHDANSGCAMAGKNARGLTIQTTNAHGRSSVYVINRDGQPMLVNPDAPPHSPDNIPEIHITFPDEQDENGRPKSGRVVVVRVGDNAAVGLEPVRDEQLPAYEKEAKNGFYSIDMNQIGGLKEKDRSQFH